MGYLWNGIHLHADASKCYVVINEPSNNCDLNWKHISRYHKTLACVWSIRKDKCHNFAQCTIDITKNKLNLLSISTLHEGGTDWTT